MPRNFKMTNVLVYFWDRGEQTELVQCKLLPSSSSFLFIFCFNATEKELQLQALKRYDTVCARGEERLVSGSDDFTLFLWQPEKDRKPVGKNAAVLSDWTHGYSVTSGCKS